AAATAKAATKFHPGSQAHITCNSGASQYILGFQTESAQAARVLAHHLGTGKNLKWMTSSGFPLINTSIKTGASVFAFPCVYSDASMLAVSVATSNDLIASTTKQVVDQLKATASSIDDVAASRAVANTKMAAYQAFESAGSLRSSLVEMVTSQNATSLADVASAYDSLNASSVSALASKTFNAKPVGVSLGNAQSVPYLDTLGF
ncbi:Cytochrome b-c1 complex subunit 2, mitochondrial, partial [Zancudomyces culisetae]